MMATPRHTSLMLKDQSHRVFPLGGTCMLRLTQDLVIFEDSFNVRCFAALNFEQFNVLRQYMKTIDDLIGDQYDGRRYSSGYFPYHLGGGWHIDMFRHKRKLDIRRWYLRKNNWSATRRGISLRYAQWERLKEVMSILHQIRLDIMVVLPCRNNDHSDNRLRTYSFYCMH
jgi:Transcriptional Coactivator p15 (PC4)